MVGNYDKSKNLEQKRAASEKAVQMVWDNMIVGLGSGSTMQIFVELISERIKKEHLTLYFVPASKKIEKYSISYGLKLLDIDYVDRIDLAFDGADRVDEQRNLIKGGGGSLFRERQILDKAKKRVIVIDPSKFVSDFAKEIIPIEIVPYNYKSTIQKINSIGFIGKLRGDITPFITDNSNYIFDAYSINKFNVKEAYSSLKLIAGVVDIGLFIENDYLIIY
nr:ribose 5-phosphate isomerase A [Lysinibacillus timonensis]